MQRKKFQMLSYCVIIILWIPHEPFGYCEIKKISNYVNILQEIGFQNQ